MCDLTNPAFTDEDKASEAIETSRWPNGAACPSCGLTETVSKLGGKSMGAGWYHCRQCREKFTVRTGTVMERSKVPLHKWLYSMYLLVTARKGISSLQLAKEIGITQKSAWFVLGRLREACSGPDSPLDKLRGTVAVDECFVGGKEANKHEHKKLKAGRGSVGKVAVLGMRERGGRTHAMVIPDTGLATIQNEIHGAYVDEFTFRLNEGNVANHTTRRLDSFVDATVGKRLTYRRLIA